MAILIPPTASTAFPTDHPSDTIDQLITQLDSNQYRQRELATQALVDSGAQGLRKLAYRYFGASPETAWRIKNILQRIGTENDNQETCFRAIAVLIVLDKNLGDGVVNLLNEWRETRSQKAIEYLVEQGAQVKYELDAAGLAGAMRIQFGGALIDDVQIVESDAEEPETESTTADEDETFDPSTAFKRVKEILAATPEQNESFVWERYREIEKRQHPVGGSTAQVIRGQLVIQGGVRGFGEIVNRPLIVFGPEWNGTTADFERLTHIHQLLGVEFHERKLELDEMAVLARLDQVQSLILDHCRFAGFELTEIVLPRNLESIELAGVTLDLDLLDWIAETHVADIRLAHSEIDSDAAIKLPRWTGVMTMRLDHLTLEKSFFEGMEKMRNLSEIEFSVTRFQPADLQAFTRRRPGCQVNFRPVAFLGVQAPMPVSRYQQETECLIDSVVSGSAASRAGVLPGDIIRKVDGQPISRFEELRMHISQHEANEELKLEIDRGGMRQELTVRLGSISDAPLR